MKQKLWTHQHLRNRITILGLCLFLGAVMTLMPDPVVAALEASAQPLFGEQEGVTAVDAVDAVDAVNVSCSSIAQISKQECEALLALYNSTNGIEWNSNIVMGSQRWFRDNAPCNWYGITCRDDHITRLDIYGRLNGTLPPELSNLAYLTQLRLYSNPSLRGEIPPGLDKLSNLTELTFFNNNLSGRIPVELGNLTNLTNLRLGSNNLSGNIPIQLGNLSKLTSLNLYGNSLSGSIPTELGNLTNLTNLNLYDNLLSGEIPSEFGNLTKLTNLSLYDNPFNGPLPTTLVNLEKMTGSNTFRFNNTQICEPQDEAMQTWLSKFSESYQTNRACPTTNICDNVTEVPVAECRALEALYNSTNGANWTNKTGWLQNETPCAWYGVSCTDGHISELKLSANKLLGRIPPEIGNLPSLVELDLANNQVTGSIPPELGNLTNLQYLYLFNNQISGILPPEMGNLTALLNLYLYNNIIGGTIPATFGNLSSLEYLNMRNNRIRGSLPTELSKLANLKLFYFHETDICEPQGTAFQTWLSGVGSVNSTDIACSEETLVTTACSAVTTIPISECMALESLYDSTNGPSWTTKTNWLTGSDPCAWYGVTCADGHVTTLWLDSNNLVGSLSPELGDLTQLTSIRLNDNYINGRIPPELGKLVNLADVRLHDNEISGYIPQELGALTKVETLYIHNNQLHSSLPSELGNLSALRILNLSNNQFSGSIPNTLGNLTNLTTLWLSRNQLSGSIPSTLGNLSNLQYLYLNENQLSGSVPYTLGKLAKLTHLWLNHNQLGGFIHPDLGNLYQLTHLWLNDNGMSSTLPMTFINLTNLSVFDFHDTDLKEIDDTAFQTWLNGVGTVNSTGEKGDEDVIPDECSGVTEITPFECRVLHEFYSLIGGASWTINTGWFQTNTPCSWHGVACGGGHVTELRLNDNNLVGGIPAVVSQLADLTVLDLGNNLLTGEMLSDLGALTSLQVLNVQNNSLTGALPDSLYTLNLHTLAYEATHVCEPTSYEFLTWTHGIATFSGSDILCEVDALTLDQTVNTPTGNPGDTLIFGLTAVTGVPSATVELLNSLPIGLVNIGNVGDASYDSENHQITYAGVISANQPLVISYTATIDPNLSPGNILQNKVEMTGLGLTLEDTTTVALPVDSSEQTLLLIYAVGDNELASDMFDMLNRVEAAANNPHVAILVLIDGAGPDDTYLFHPTYDTDENCPSALNITCNGRYVQGKNLSTWTDKTTDPYSLSRFIQTGMRTYPNAERVVVSLVGHGAGWAPNTKYAQPPVIHGQPDPVGGLLLDNHPKQRSMSTRALGKAFKWVYEATGKKIDLVYFDACSMGMWEVAYEVSPYVNHQMFSANTAWATFPYDQHISVIDGEKSVQEIGKAWIQNEITSLGGNYPFTFSLVESAQLDGIQEGLNQISDALVQRLYDDAATRTKLSAAFDAAERFESNYDGVINELDTYGDILSFAKALGQQFPDLSSQVAQLQTALTNAVLMQEHGNGSPWLYPDSVWHWEEIGNIGIYLPFHQDEWKRDFYNENHLKSAAMGTWDELIAAFWDTAEADQRRASRTNNVSVQSAELVEGAHSASTSVRLSAHAEVSADWESERLPNSTTAIAPPVCPPDCDGMGAPLNLMPTLLLPAHVQTTYPGTVTMTVDFDPYGNSTVEGAFIVEFDDACLAVDPSMVKFSGATGTATLNGANKLVLSHIQPNGSSALQTGELMHIPFTTVCQADAGSSITTSVTITAATFVDGEGASIPGTAVDGSIVTHNDGIEGDINGDGKVNIIDLDILISMILHHTPEDTDLHSIEWWTRANLWIDAQWNIFDLDKLISLILS
ncbi:MAG: leucine-rich repeat domain-containing protein [Chloroflexota bacterium]